MSNPQQPELARSRKTPHQDQDSVAAVVDGRGRLEADAPPGPVPAENQPGHHPPEEQDKPDLDAFAERFGIADASSPPADAVTSQAPGTRAVIARTAAVVAAVVALATLVMTLKRRRSARR